VRIKGLLMNTTFLLVIFTLLSLQVQINSTIANKNNTKREIDYLHSKNKGATLTNTKKSSKPNRSTIKDDKMKLNHYVLFSTFVILVAVASPIMLQNDPKRPVASIAHDLDIEPDQFVTCFNDVQPAPQGSTPTSAQVHSNKQHLLSCLQKFNPAIINEKLDAVMDKYRPSP
jgi:hypothetical protein